MCIIHICNVPLHRIVEMQRKPWNSRKDVVRQPFVALIHFALVIVIVITVILDGWEIELRLNI